MYAIKQISEDFIVDEISLIKPKQEGRYSYWTLKKKDYTTVRAVEHIASALNIPSKYIGFAGAKDRNAVTSQVISIKAVARDRIEAVRLKDISLEYLGKGDSPVSLGGLEGNRFCIVVRNIEKAPERISRMLNLFGEQRFSKNNAEIGKAMVKGDFRKAVELLQEGEGEIEAKVRKHLDKQPNDFVGALKTIERRILMLYIHSYQSYIWNMAAEEHARQGIDTEEISIVGFGTVLSSNDRIISGIMQREGIAPRDFVIRALPYLSSEGGERKMHVDISGLEIGELEDDELNPGRKKCTVRFTLPKGSYATVAIAQMMA